MHFGWYLNIVDMPPVILDTPICFRDS